MAELIPFVRALLPVVLFYILSKLLKHKTEQENHLKFKLAGYTILGLIFWKVQGLYLLPLGFLVYLLFFRPKKNRGAKTYAVVIGFMAIFSQYMVGAVDDYIFNQPKTMKASSSNIYDIDFVEDFRSIQKRLWMRYVHIDNLLLTYREDGSIETFEYDIWGQRNNGTGIATVHLEPGTHTYSIQSHMAEKSFSEIGRSMKADSFFRQLQGTDLERLMPETQFEHYVLTFDGDVPDSNNTEPKFAIVGTSLIPITERHEILFSYFIESFGIGGTKQEKSETTWYKLNGYTNF